MADNLEDIFGSEQLVGRFEGGVEASIHVINDLFSENSSQCHRLMILDAANALTQEWPLPFCPAAIKVLRSFLFKDPKNHCIVTKAALRAMQSQCFLCSHAKDTEIAESFTIRAKLLRNDGAVCGGLEERWTKIRLLS